MGFALGGSFVWSLYAPPQAPHENYPANRTEHTGAESRQQTQSLWVPTDSIGLYTLVLAVFTGLLFATSAFQGYFLIRADRTARISADAAATSAKAARDAADAAIATERAHFYVVINDNFIDCINSAAAYENTASADENPLAASNLPMAKFAFKNYGKTPGIVIEVGSGIIFSESVPDPVYDIKIVNENIVGADKTTETFMEVITPPEMTLGMAKKVRDGGGNIWIYGYAIYDDVFGERQTHRFFQRLVCVIPRARYVLQAYDYKHYNISN
jgi:hypothetical protein